MNIKKLLAYIAAIAVISATAVMPVYADTADKSATTNVIADEYRNSRGFAFDTPVTTSNADGKTAITFAREPNAVAYELYTRSAGTIVPWTLAATLIPGNYTVPSYRYVSNFAYTDASKPGLVGGRQYRISPVENEILGQYQFIAEKDSVSAVNAISGTVLPADTGNVGIRINADGSYAWSVDGIVYKGSYTVTSTGTGFDLTYKLDTAPLTSRVASSINAVKSINAVTASAVQREINGELSMWLEIKSDAESTGVFFKPLSGSMLPGTQTAIVKQ